MSKAVLIMGKSGSGKSASLRNFTKDEVDIINVIGKELPFRNDHEPWQTDDYSKVMAGIAKSKKKAVVVDDAGFLITNQFMRNHAAGGQGNAIFSMYNDLADNFWRLITAIKENDEPDKIVYLIMHEDQNDLGAVKPKTIGKLLDEKVCIESMFTIVLRSEYDGERYIFKTKTSGLDVTKTPIGMFDDEEIDNDLKAVDAKIREYYILTAGGATNSSQDSSN